MPAASRPSVPLHVVALALAAGALLVLLPFAVPLILAAWIADLTRALVTRLERRVGGRRVAAAIVTVLLVLLSAGPLALAVTVLAAGAGDLIDELRRVSTAGALESSPAAESMSVAGWIDVVRRYLATGHGVLLATVRGSTRLAVDVVVLVAAVYVFASRTETLRGWVEGLAPTTDSSFVRLADAFYETGRGLLVAIGGTALVQGVIATLAYVALGVPHGALFGFLTAIAAATLPAVGTAVIWVPVAVGLAVLGHPVRAVILGALGLAVIGTIDNVLRPVLARYAKLQLPVFLLFLSMLGGLFLLGGAGIVLGPLLVRMAVEALALIREQRQARRPDTA
jgi:predicted PurR-regulated permease PerM